VQAFPGLGFKEGSGEESLRHSAAAWLLMLRYALRNVRGFRASVIGIQRMACVEGQIGFLYNVTMRRIDGT
jgi:hypothetical protein